MSVIWRKNGHRANTTVRALLTGVTGKCRCFNGED